MKKRLFRLTIYFRKYFTLEYLVKQMGLALRLNPFSRLLVISRFEKVFVIEVRVLAAVQVHIIPRTKLQA